LKDGKHTYALVDERLPPGQELAPEEATARLVKRYLAGHAPATLKDLRWWSGLKVTELRRAVDALGDAVAKETIGRREYLWLGSDPPEQAAEDDVSLELLQVFDELFVGYSETRDLLDADGEFGPVLQIGFSKMMHVVVDGDRLLGRWRHDRRKKTLVLTFDLNRPLATDEQTWLREAAAAYGAFMGAGESEVVLAHNTRRARSARVMRGGSRRSVHGSGGDRGGPGSQHAVSDERPGDEGQDRDDHGRVHADGLLQRPDTQVEHAGGAPGQPHHHPGGGGDRVRGHVLGRHDHDG